MFSSNNTGSNNLYNVSNFQYISAEDLTTESANDEFLTLGDLSVDNPTYFVKKTKLSGHHALINTSPPITNTAGTIGCGFDNSTITLNGSNQLQVADPHSNITFSLPLNRVANNVSFTFDADELTQGGSGELKINYTNNFAVHNNQFDLAEQLSIGGIIGDASLTMIDNAGNTRFDLNTSGTFSYNDASGNALFSYIDNGANVDFIVNDISNNTAIGFEDTTNIIGLCDSSGSPLIKIDRINNEVFLPNIPLTSGGTAGSLYIDNTSVVGVNLVCMN